MKTKINIVFALLVLILSYEVFIHATSPGSSSSNTAYVNTVALYNSFDYKNELEAQLTEVQTARQAVLDSMELDLQRMLQVLQTEGETGAVSAADFETLRAEYLSKQETFISENEQLAAAYTERIWKQLNQYVNDYGSDHGYEYIFGADGQGKLMYANEARDVTEELQAYVNSRFSGESR